MLACSVEVGVAAEGGILGVEALLPAWVCPEGLRGRFAALLCCHEYYTDTTLTCIAVSCHLPDVLLVK